MSNPSEGGRFKDLPIQRVIIPPSETLPRELEIAIHPAKSNTIIINYPGANGDIDGFNDKHKTLASCMQAEGLGAVLRLSNKPAKGEPWEAALRVAIEYALAHGEEICGADKPNLFITGTSAGGGAAALIAHEYEAVKNYFLWHQAQIAGLNKPQMGSPDSKAKSI